MNIPTPPSVPPAPRWCSVTVDSSLMLSLLVCGGGTRIARPACRGDSQLLPERKTMDLLTWLIVGLIAGVLASLVAGGGFGIIADIVIGIVGAFIGGWLFGALGVSTPFGGLAGTIFTAFIGAVILILILRASSRRRRA